MRDEDVIDFSIDEVFVEETRFHPLVKEVDERSVVSVMEVAKKVAFDSSAIGHELWQATDIT